MDYLFGEKLANYECQKISKVVIHKGPVRKSHMATRGKLNYLPSQVFCNEGQTTILVEMWEKMSEKLNLWKDEEIYKGKNHVMIYGNHSVGAPL